MLAPSFLADRRHKRIHGTEVFNFYLVRRLVESGYRVCVPAEPAWRSHLDAHFNGLDDRLDVFYSLPFRKPLPCSLAALPGMLARGPFDLVVLANVARGILPATWALQKAGRARRSVVIAHQYPKPAFLKSIQKTPIEIMAVSRSVADRIAKHTDKPSWVSYGILNFEEFFPADRPPREVNTKVRFGVVGQLDTPWKGAALALEAWALLPAEIKARAELHMAAYKNPPRVEDPSVTLHDWMPHDRVGAFMRTLDVMIVPSTSAETFSQVTVQAMLTGLPVLAFHLPVLAEKLDTGGGAVFASARELADHITAIARDPARIAPIAEVARRTALERYCWSVKPFIERYLPPATPLKP